MVESKRSRKIINFVLVSLLILHIFLTLGCVNNSTDNSRIDTDIVIGMTGNISGFFPWMQTRDTSSLSVNTNLFNCLAEIDPDSLKFSPALAESWNNPNNVTWRFFLRKDVQFHNGNDFTSEDVKFTIEYMRDYPFHKEELEAISEIEIVDTHTIDIKTYQPYPLLLYKLGTLFILSKEYMQEIEETNTTWPIGTGAYKLLNYTPGEHIILERFDEYWKGPPEVATVTFKKMNSSEDVKNALIKKEIDIAPLSSDYIDEVSNIKGLAVKSVQTPSVFYLSFDFRVNDSYGFFGIKNPVSDMRVRKAMYHAINITTIIEQYLNNSATPASQFLTPHTFGYNPNTTRLPYDLTLATQLMKDAGYEEGFTIELDIPDSPKYVSIANEIATQLSMIQINVTLNSQPTSEYYSKLYYRNTSLYITGWSPLDAESTIKILLHTPNLEESIGIWNYGNYSNPEVDRLCAIMSYTMEPELRKKYIQEAFSIAASDIAWIPLFSTKAFYGIREDIKWNPRPSSFIWVEEIGFK